MAPGESEPLDPSTEPPDDADLILRHISRLFPEALVRALIKTPEPIVVEGWIDTQVTGRQRRLEGRVPHLAA